MKVLLLGGGGYLGTRLTGFLQNLNMGVTVVDLFWFGNYLKKNSSYYPHDVSKIDDDFYEDFEVVVYLAGLSNDPMAEFSPKLNYIHNTAYPMICASQAKKAGVKKFIFASSCSIYGVGRGCEEWSEPHTDYPYGISKWQAEKGLELLNDENFQVISLRKGTLGGHSDRMRFDLAVNRMFKTAMVDKIITVYDPLAFRPLLDITDAVRAYSLAIFAPPEISGPFNIVSENMSVMDLAIRMKQYMEKEGIQSSIEIKNLKKKEVRDYSANWDKAMDQLGFTGNNTIEVTIDELYVNHKLNAYYYDDPTTINIEVFKKIEGRL